MLKNWAIERDGVIVESFLAPQDLIDNFEDRVVKPNSVVTPPWAETPGYIFHDVTNLDPRPTIGYFKSTAGVWIDGRPTLDISRGQIPADGTTAAIVTFKQKGKTAPSSVIFDVNGVKSTPQPLTNGAATVEIVSSTPGDIVVISVGELDTTLVVEG